MYKATNECRTLSMAYPSMRRILLILAFFFAVQFAKSSHGLGGYIRYESQGGYKYKLIAVAYRDCRGVTLGTPTFGVFSGTNHGNGCGSSSLSGFTLVSIKDITTICKTDTAPCVPQNKTASGVGIEEFTYTKNIDLSQSPFSSYLNKSSCCEITFYMSWTARTGFSSGCGTGSNPCDNFNTLATLNMCNLRKCADTTNSTVFQKSKPLMLPGCNQAIYHSTGFSDSDKDDSLKFNLACAIATLPNSTVSYTSPFSCQYFMTPYCVPPTTIKCSPNFKTDPPRGVWFDTVTGDLQATPTKCDEVFTYVPEYHEYRKDTSGKWIEIGRGRRDYAVFVNANIGYNKSPKIEGPSIINICAGDKLCFDIKGKDETFTPYQTIPDTVNLWWDTAIPAATFTIKNPSDREKTGQFCWQTHDSDVRNTAYRFTIYVSDQHCSPPVISSRTILIRVSTKPKGHISLKTGPCGSIYLAGNKDSSYSGDAKYSWTVTDSSGNNWFASTKDKDTVSYLPKGLYYVKMGISNIAGCGAVLYDTIAMGPLPTLYLGQDTFSCMGSAIELQPKSISFAQKPYQYSWEIQGKHYPADTLSDIRLSSITKDTSVVLHVTDSFGCKFSDSQHVFVKPLPSVSAGPDIRICTYEIATLKATASPVGGTFQWNRGDTTSSITSHLKGKYAVKYTEPEFSCSQTDTAEVIVNDTVKAFAGKDQEFCGTAVTTFQASHEPAYHAVTYYWSDINAGLLLSNKSSLNVSLTNAVKASPDRIGRYELRAHISDFGHLCVGTDTVNLIIHSLPKTEWKQNNILKRCHSEGRFELEPWVSLPDSAHRTHGKFRMYSLQTSNNLLDSLQPDLHFYRGDKLTEKELGGGKYYSDKLVVWASDTNSCASTDTLGLWIMPNPYIQLDTSVYCQNKSWVKLDSSVVRPKTKFGTKQLWKLLYAPAGIDTTGLVADKSPGFGTDWELDFGPPHNNNYAGTYTLQFSVTDLVSGCNSKATTDVIVYPEPVLTSSNPNPVCYTTAAYDLSGLFLADGKKPSIAASQYTLYSYNGMNSPSAFGNAKIDGHYFYADKTGKWRFVVKNQENGCLAIDTFGMEMVENPVAKFSTAPNDSTAVSNPTFQLTNNSSISNGDALSAIWHFEYPSTWHSSNIYSPSVRYPSIDSQYTIELIVSSSWCSDTALQDVKIGHGKWIPNSTVGFESGTIKIDNAFRVLNIEFSMIEVRVYNAAGQLVSKKVDNEGVQLPAGTYYYLIQLQKGREKPAVFRGKHLVQSN